MRAVSQATVTGPAAPGLSGALAFAQSAAQAGTTVRCGHCGNSCRTGLQGRDDKVFCCLGCLTVFELLTENGLGAFYDLRATPGIRVEPTPEGEQFKFLDEPAVRERLVDFADERTTRVTFRIPAIHCLACVWLLEHLFRLKPGLGPSRVNFLRKELTLSLENGKVKLSEAAALLASLGYEPELNFADLQDRPGARGSRRLWLQLAVAGFAFGNIMLFSLPSYFGLDRFSGPAFRGLFGCLSLVLALPVLFYSAADYWRAAWLSLRQRRLNLEVPIALGIVALFSQSAYEVIAERGPGYFDSLAGLLFFLLCGKLFQRKTYDRLAFDRDYQSFFPLSVIRLSRSRRELPFHPARDPLPPAAAGSLRERVSLAQLEVGDRLIIRSNELLPADSRLRAGVAVIDYSFVTGESEPVEKNAGDYLYAGGRQIGGAIEVETVKPVSQSYLASLWSQEAFRKKKPESLHALTNAYSQRFTGIVIGIALAAALFWGLVNPALSIRALTSVLIVACPCALALAAPFALGTAQRVLGRQSVFLKNPGVLETLARVDVVVFDKTGTLTDPGADAVTWWGAGLSEEEQRWLRSMTCHSTHPLAVRIGEGIGRQHVGEPVRAFLETAGCGMEGIVAGHQIWMGSAAWLESRGVPATIPSPGRSALSPLVDLEKNGMRSGLIRPESRNLSGPASAVHVAIDQRYRGCFRLTGALRPDVARLLAGLAPNYELALSSGDNEKERDRFRELFGDSAHVQFNQSPMEKLNFIQRLQRKGRTVMMVGDGLNDAGALKQSDVGVAVVESLNAFSPASDVILSAGMVPRLPSALQFAKSSVRVVRLSFLLSSLYNLVGIGIAASGHLSPIICAILMPLSSVTVVTFACGATSWLGRRWPAHPHGRCGGTVDSELDDALEGIPSGVVSAATTELA